MVVVASVSGQRRLGNLLADHGDLVILQSLLIQPVRAGNLLERVDGGLDALGPGDGDQLDVAVNIADREDAAPAAFEVSMVMLPSGLSRTARRSSVSLAERKPI